jgi:hypothetical protein
LNLVLAGWFHLPPSVYGWVAHIGALLVAVTATHGIAGRLAKLMPRTESYNLSNEDLVGCLGTTLYAVTETTGMAQVKDRHGDVQKVVARTTVGERLGPNQPIVVVAFDDERNQFTVTATRGEGAVAD